ncbi:MAG: N-6 DNA methylase [Thermoguttaceae bacterium]|jgi:hypothetical protein
MTNAAGPAFVPCPLVEDFGRKSSVAREGVQAIYTTLRTSDNTAIGEAFARWQALEATTHGQQATRLTTAIRHLTKSLSMAANDLDPRALLFALQTYYALLVRTVLREIHPSLNGSARDGLFDWCEAAGSPAIKETAGRIAKQVHSDDLPGLLVRDTGGRDLFKALYEDLFPKPLRHALGEYYTPDWLAEHVLDQSGYSGDPATRLLDPACGSGTFLVAAINRLRARLAEPTAERALSKGEMCRQILNNIVGFDLNPLAVLSARANYLIALGDLAAHVGPDGIPVCERDSILTPSDAPSGSAGRFDFVVGNPPWIAWDDLPPDYREATKPLWEQYGLFTLSGSEARHGGGKKDLSMLMVYKAADHYLADHGRLAMVITQTLFQTKGAGDGFRRFRLGREGSPLRVLRVDDLVALKPFAGAANWTSTLVLEKGSPTVYPVPYVRWNAPPRANGSPQKAGPSQTVYDAEPVDPQKPTSPWFLRPAGLRAKIGHLIGPSDYAAHLGANTGGANGVFWCKLVGPADGGVQIRNLATTGRRSSRQEEVEAVVEPELLYPLLRWGDVARYRARPAAHVLLVQDPKTRRGIEEETLKRRCPRTYDYLKRFEPLLLGRAAYRRYQQQGPFYSMYDIDHYTLAPIKVVWRRMDRQINAAVVEPWNAPLLGPRPMVPQETCVLIACDTPEEAHYLCALLNSAVVGFLVRSHSVRGGKGFGTPGMLDVLRLGQFASTDARHQQLAALSREAHAAVQAGKAVDRLQEQMDELAAGLWELDRSDLTLIRREAW